MILTESIDTDLAAMIKEASVDVRQTEVDEMQKNYNWYEKHPSMSGKRQSVSLDFQIVGELDIQKDTDSTKQSSEGEATETNSA